MTYITDLLKGVPGPTGATGATGTPGPAGAPGSTGPTGMGLNPRGKWSFGGDYVKGDYVTNRSLDNANKVSIWVCLNDIIDSQLAPHLDLTNWSEIEITDGPTGATGPTGKDGVDGAPGAKGKTGATGKTGPAGGPRGPTGPQGPQGLQGQPGQDGQDGQDGLPGPQGPKGATGTAIGIDITIGDTPPVSPSEYDLWIDTSY